MIKANHKKLWLWFFETYAKFHFRRIFEDVRFMEMGSHSGELSDLDGPCIIISNHFWFWDGFVHLMLNNRVFKKRLYIMMLQSQMEGRRFLRYGGCFSIDKGHRGVIESLKYCSEILKDSSNMLLIFPQGEIQSLYTKAYRFEKGVEYILNQAPKAKVLFNINLLNFYSLKSPVLTMYCKQHLLNGRNSVNELEESFNEFSDICHKNESPITKGISLL